MVPELRSTDRTAAQDEPLGVLPPGTLLHGFEIKSVLGQGGFGITYLARDTKLEREVAIKEYLPTALALRHEGTMVAPRSTDVLEDFVWGRERFLDEARTLARLEGAPAVVRVIDFLEANGTAYTVMVLARGQSLDRLIRSSGALTSSQVDRLLPPLLSGLERVHAEGFLHRDIKPANIIVGDDGAPTLIDFGASRAAISGRSHTLTAIFTPGYAAAEQMTSARQGPWTDIYALSATLYHAITGGVPPSAFDRILHDNCEALTVLKPEGFRPGLLAGIDRGLSVRAESRPQSVAEWRPMLDGSASRAPAPSNEATVAVRRLPPEPSPAAAPAPPSVPTPRPHTEPRTEPQAAPPAATSAPPARPKRWIWAGVAAVVLLAAGAAAYSTRSLFVGATVQSMTAEELSRALDERRKADAAADEKKRLENEARLKADSDSEAKRKAEEELATAQQERLKAEQELASLKADIEARRKAEESERSQAATAAQKALDEATQKQKIEAELAALRKADEDAKAKVAAEQAARAKAAAEAESKRQADEALARAQAERLKAEAEATRQQAELEARQRGASEAKARAEAEAKAKAEMEAKAKADADAEMAKKAAEAAESALKLSLANRQHVQVALTAAGFDTRGNDGSFGVRSREMIAAWQKAQGQPPTGFLTASQQQTLIKNGAVAIKKFDDDQKKIEDDKRKADEEARRKADEEAKKKEAAAAPAPVQPPAPPSAPKPVQPSAVPPAPANYNAKTRPGTEVYINAHGNWDRACAGLPRPDVAVLTPPSHGKVQIRAVMRVPNGCSKPIEMTGIYYTPNPGFTGVDRFTYERKSDIFGRSPISTLTAAIEVR